MSFLSFYFSESLTEVVWEMFCECMARQRRKGRPYLWIESAVNERKHNESIN